MTAAQPDSDTRVGPFRFQAVEPIGAELRVVLEERRRVRARRANSGFAAFLILIVMAFVLGIAGGASRVAIILAGLSVIISFAGLVRGAWWRTLLGSTERHLRDGTVWRFELDPALLPEPESAADMPQSIEAFPDPLLLAAVDGRPVSEDVPLTIGADWLPLPVNHLSLAAAGATIGR